MRGQSLTSRASYSDSLTHLCDTGSRMHSSLQPLLEQLRSCMQDLDEPSAQLHPQKDHARWSVQQEIEHLVMTFRSSCVLFEDRIAKNRPVQRKPTLREGFRQIFVIDFGYYPKGISAPA